MSETPSRTLQDELRQTKPFTTLEEEAVVSITRTAALLENDLTELLKPHGLTPTQYNVLRILRGAGTAGLSRYEVGDRLVSPGPDVTRLLDRLESSGLVDRARDPEDRRHVKARITSQGLALLESLEAPLATLQAQQIGHLGTERLRSLVDLLSVARGR